MGSQKKRRAWAGALLILLVPAIAFTAAVDYFLKIDGIDGESTAKGHEKEIDVESWSWGESQNAGGPASCASGNAVFKTKGAPSSGKLAAFQMQRRPIPMMVVEIRGERHMLRNAMLTKHEGGAFGDGSVHTFELSFVCATHPGGVNNPAMNKHLKIKGESTEGILIGLLLPAVQKVREAASPMTLGKLEIQGTRAVLLVKAGDPGHRALGDAFRTKQQLPWLKLAGRSPNETWTFSEVTVMSVGPSQIPGMEQVSLNFTKVEGPLAGFNAYLKFDHK